MPQSESQLHPETGCLGSLFFLIIKKLKKEVTCGMKNKQGNPYATNKGGMIKAPKNPAKDSPKATVTKGNDLRVGKK